MSKISFKSVVIAAIALVVPVVASANDEVRSLTQNPNYWAYPGGNYDNHRYSALKQINNKNAGKIQTAWTFSTGVLRGHEGGPLVLPSSATGLSGDTLYINPQTTAVHAAAIKLSIDVPPLPAKSIAIQPVNTNIAVFIIHSPKS